MSIADLAIKRPTFITCIFMLILVVGGLSLFRLPVDLYPNINFPIIVVTTTYPGAGPVEVENLISKPLEDALNTVSGIKNLRSTSKEGVSIVVAEFTLSTDSKYAEQQVKDRVTSAVPRLPADVNQPSVRAFDPTDMPILTIALSAKKGPAELFDLADQSIKPYLQQVPDVGFVEVVGGRRREVHVLLDREKLLKRNISASMVANQLGLSGKNVPAGKTSSHGREAVVRTLGEYDSLANIENTIVSFYGNEVATKVSDVATVKETLADEASRTFVDGKEALTLLVFRRSGSNTVAVAEAVKAQVAKLNSEYKSLHEGFDLNVVQDGSKPIKANVFDVGESIVLGILLTIFVVLIFLGSLRSTFITGIALPNSLLGAFILMLLAGFSINIMTLLALSLAVGLLIDDAIVVRENIFRHIEEGMSARDAASHGTKEVTLAVVATTMTVLAVFGPVAFLQGIVGQFFKEFGLTVCFAMMISLFDALTMAPMLSAYFAGKAQHTSKAGKAAKGRVSSFFSRLFHSLQIGMNRSYAAVLQRTLRFPIVTLSFALLVFLGGFYALGKVPKTFTPTPDNGEFTLSIQMPPGTALEQTSETIQTLDGLIKKSEEVFRTVVTVGGRNGEPNEAEVFVQLVPYDARTRDTSAMKGVVREMAAAFDFASPKIIDRGGGGGGIQPLIIMISGTNLGDTRQVAEALYAKMTKHPDLKDVNISYKEGKPEYQVVVDRNKAQGYGISATSIGQELRAQIEGLTPAVYRKNGNEYDIRVRLQDGQRNIQENFSKTYVPNMNARLIKLDTVATPKEVFGPAAIERQNRSRYIQVAADTNPQGRGLGHAIEEIKQMFESKEIALPPGVQYQFYGQAENFQELLVNMMIAAFLAIVFIYFVLASLYESFITPLTIMLVLPLAICGAFYALWICNASFDIFSMIGCIMLLGVATKNSILLVDYTNQQLEKGVALKEAIIAAGRVRLRPIIMTTLALIAGMLPVAIGLNEASKQRTSMGIAIIGGLISSTLLTLVVVPAAYSYIEAFRGFVNKIKARIVTK